MNEVRKTTLNREVSEQSNEDQKLAHRIRNGDEAAFAELYACHKHGVYLYCTRFLGPGPAAEDVFQEIFMNCFEHIRAGKEIRNIRGYLLSSVHNRCLNVIRNRKYPMDIDDCEHLLPSHHQSFGETIDLQYALQQLSVENREALILREYQGYSYEEIGEIVGVPVTTIRKRIFHARQKLREILNPNANKD